MYTDTCICCAWVTGYCIYCSQRILLFYALSRIFTGESLQSVVFCQNECRSFFENDTLFSSRNNWILWIDRINLIVVVLLITKFLLFLLVVVYWFLLNYSRDSPAAVVTTICCPWYKFSLTLSVCVSVCLCVCTSCKPAHTSCNWPHKNNEEMFSYYNPLKIF